MTKIAFASRHSVSYVAETEHGVTPDNPVMKELRNTSCSLNLTRDSFTSSELRRDRQISDVRTGTNQIGGDIGVELSSGAFDDFLEACLAGTWTDNELKAGVEERSFTIERAFNDIGEYTAYKGCFLNTLNLSLQPNAMATATFGVVGMDAVTSRTPLAANPAPAAANRPYDTYLGELKEDGESIAVVTGIDLTLDNGIEPHFVLFRRSAPVVSWGKSNVSGTLTAFFENQKLLGKFLDENRSSLEFTLGSGAASYTFILPRIFYTGSELPVDSEGPVSLSMPFQAVLDDCEGTNIIIRRIPAESSAPSPCALAWSATSLAESTTTPGEISGKITVTLSGGNGKTFAGTNNYPLAGVTFASVPDGLTAIATRLTATTVEISFSGAAKSHQAADSATVTATFSASAFRQGFCHCQGGSVTDAEKTITLTFADDATPPAPDTTAPALAFSVPANGATDVAASTSSIVLTFSEAVEAGSGSLTITNTSDSSDAITVDISTATIADKTVTASFTDTLTAGSEYEVTMPSGVITDLADNAFAGIAAGELKFTIASA